MSPSRPRTTPNPSSGRRGVHPHRILFAVVFMIATVAVLTFALLYVWRAIPRIPQPASSIVAPIPAAPAIPTDTVDCGSHGHWNGSACLCGGIAGWSCPTDQECGDMKPTPTTPDAMGTCHAKSTVTSTESIVLGLSPATTSTEGRAVKIFLLKGYYGEDFQPAFCGDGKFFSVYVPKTNTPIQTTLDGLLHWADLLDGEGYTSDLPEGTQLLSTTLSGGVLRLQFSKELENYSGGSCNVESIRTQIEKTAMQFGNVNTVEISVPGKTAAETLQP